MQVETQIINIINDKLKNPIYQTIQLLNMNEEHSLQKQLQQKRRCCGSYGCAVFCLYAGDE